MGLGSEDFSASAGMLPTPETLYQPNQQIVFACRRAGITPYGFPASIAEFSDMAVLQSHIEKASDMGFVGGMCIHPNQVAVLNAVMTPKQEDVDHAEALLSAWLKAESDGVGAFKFEGKMVDKPVILRAQELLRRYAKINSPAKAAN
jgi:citrate lyase subunit beta/citryl-CoA lyase